MLPTIPIAPLTVLPGTVKRVVLFDTLLERMNSEEILGVLAHELGHWKKGHVPQRFEAGNLLNQKGLG